jgi:hypothetical protein
VAQKIKRPLLVTHEKLTQLIAREQVLKIVETVGLCARPVMFGGGVMLYL